jgi:hypothetical protein
MEFITNWLGDRAHDVGAGMGLSEDSEFYRRTKGAQEALGERDPKGAAAELEGVTANTSEGRAILRRQKEAIGVQGKSEASRAQDETYSKLYGKPAPGKGYLQELQDRQTATQAASQRQILEAQKKIQELQNKGASDITRMQTGTQRDVAGIQARSGENIATTQAQANLGSTNIAGAWGTKQADVAGKWGFESTARNALAQENTTNMATGRQLLAQLDANNVQREVAEKDHKHKRMELLGNMYLQSKAGNQNFVLGAGARKAGF